MGPKGKPNGFLLYANEIRNRLLMEGHVIQNTPDLIKAASPSWEELSSEEKEFYKNLAKVQWENKSKTVSKNLRKDNTGSLVNNRVDFVKINENKRILERNEVRSSWPPGREVLDKKFYFASFVCLLEEPEYQALEIAVVEFSLRYGIERSFHKHINPGPIPTGYRFMAQQKSNLTHQIPVEGIASPEDTYVRIYDELVYFLIHGSDEIPPIHVRISECDKTDGCLKWLAKNAGRTNQLKRVYELEGLILDLDSHLRGQKEFKSSKQNATDVISSTVFDWDAGIRCKWHEEKGSKTCALSFANRYCYCLSNYFCENFDIPITEHHLPLKKDEVCYTLVPSTSSLKGRNSKWNENSANEIADRLRILSENQRNQEDSQNKEFKSQQNTAELKKRWLTLRGGQNQNDESNTDVQTNKEVRNFEEYKVFKDPIDNILTKNGVTTDNQSTRIGLGRGLLGRGRGILGRGAGLRKPGEAPCFHHIESTSQSSQNKLNEIEKMYAGPIAAPHPSAAPQPPASWVA